MGDWSDITKITYAFLTVGPLKAYMPDINSIYQDSLENIDSFFVDPANKTSLKPNVTDLIKDKIIDSIKATATETTDHQAIKLLINGAIFKVGVDGKSSTARYSKKNLETAMTNAVKSGEDGICVHIGLNHMYIASAALPTMSTATFLDWDIFSTTATLIPPPPAPMTAADIATICSREVTAAIATVLARTMIGTTTTGATATTGTTGTTAGTTTPSSAVLFNPASLPIDVRDRYNIKKNGLVITKSDIAPFKPFPPATVCLYYHLDGPDRLFLPDGTLFLI